MHKHRFDEQQGTHRAKDHSGIESTSHNSFVSTVDNLFEEFLELADYLAFTKYYYLVALQDLRIAID